MLAQGVARLFGQAAEDAQAVQRVASAPKLLECRAPERLPRGRLAALARGAGL